jgi:hypothetical protein
MNTGRDFKVAVVLGTLTEFVLGMFGFMAQGNIAWTNPWLEISQKPGAEIAVLLFRFVSDGLLLAWACVLLVQSAIFVSLIFTVMYVYRVLRSRVAPRWR